MTPAEYLASIGVDAAGWEVREAFMGGEVVGFTMVRGPEIHIHSTRPGRALSRKNVREALAPVLAEHGYVTTRVPISETDHRLRHVLGFTQTWADDQFTYWALTELPFQKGGTPCH